MSSEWAGSRSDSAIPVSTAVYNVAVKMKELQNQEQVRKANSSRGPPPIPSPGILSVDNELRPYICKLVSLQRMSANHHFILITIARGLQSRNHYPHFTSGITEAQDGKVRPRSTSWLVQSQIAPL